jgi:hypothetical protein
MVTLSVILAACGSTATPAAKPVSPAIKHDQRYAVQANLKTADLPSGWTEQPSGSSAPVIGLSTAQTTSVNTIMAKLPSACRSLKETFIGSLESAPPVDSVVQNVAQFSSPKSSAGSLSSTVAVYASLPAATVTYGLYAEPAFTSCLEGFLRGALVQIFQEKIQQETITAVPALTVPSGVSATAFSVASRVTQTSGNTGNGETQKAVTVSQETVLLSGRSLAFVVAENGSSTMPAATQAAYQQAVATVASKLLPPLT